MLLIEIGPEKMLMFCLNYVFVNFAFLCTMNGPLDSFCGHQILNDKRDCTYKISRGFCRLSKYTDLDIESLGRVT